jgi:hypothetical protein
MGSTLEPAKSEIYNDLSREGRIFSDFETSNAQLLAVVYSGPT